MKKSILTLALFAAPLAFAATNDATTMDQETVSTSDMHYDTNSNARFDNRDTRTNSQSTPASIGAEKSHLDPDVTSNKYIDPNAPASDERMTGSSTEDLNSNSSAATIDQNQMNSNPSNAYDSTYNSDEQLSGSATESTAPAAEATGAAAATGATTTESTTDTTTTTTTKTKKAKKGHKGHHKSGSSSSTDSSSNSTVYPKSSSSDVTDSYNRSGSTTETPSSSSTPGSTASERSTGSSTMDSMSGSSRPAGSSTGAAATGAAAGAAAGSKMNSDSSYHKDLTAQDTSAQKSDAEVVRKIRSEITDNKDLSVNAHNIKIISQNNQIVLKGQVADANEKMKVEEIAKRFAGNTKVLNQTMIDSRSGSSTNK
jgi:osmotically-inducible protein OsmY